MNDTTALERQLSELDRALGNARDLIGHLSSIRYEVWNDLMAARMEANTSGPPNAGTHYGQAEEQARRTA